MKLTKWLEIQVFILIYIGLLNIKSAVVAPLQVITRTVNRLSKVSDMLAGADLKNILENIVRQLASQDLYGPTERMINDMDQDTMAKE